MTELVDAAVLLAERGYRVFPVGSDKAPRIAGGFNAASDILERIWGWEQLGLFKDGGIGLVIPDRTFVVDVDPRNGGDSTLRALVMAGDYDLPLTRTVRTRSGGTHFYYALPDDRDLRGKLGPGVDIKKPGRGYVLVPPTPGYVYTRGGKPVAAPQWLLDELTMSTRSVDTASTPKFFPGLQSGTAYGMAALRQKLEQVRETGEGGRRETLNTVAFVLGTLAAGGELDGDKTLEALFDAALDTGLTEQQALSAIKSGWHAGLQKPRQSE